MTAPGRDTPGGGRHTGSLAGLPAPEVVDDDARTPAGALSTRADRLADALAAHGVGPGDRVVWQLPNRREAVALFHACWRLGAVAVPVHHRLGAGARGEVADRCGASLTLADADLEPAPTDVPVARGDDGLAALAGGASRFRRAGGGPAGTDPADPALVLATSGTTGRPKLVRHTHRGLLHTARALVAAHGLGADDTVLVPAPLAHVAGVLNGVLLPGAAGMRTVLMGRWEPRGALELIEREEVTFLAGPPTFLLDLMGDPAFSPSAVERVRLVSLGGAGVTAALAQRVGEAFAATVKRTYGATEAPHVATWHAGDPPERAATSDGRAVGGAELRVRDPDTREELPPGRLGELVVRGPGLCDGYVDGPDPFEDGWLPTGDLARVDAEGWLTVAGRRDDTIVRGGENISPAEVEAVCAELPGVRRAVAVGYPDARLGQRVGLVVEADREVSLDEVARHCAASGLARFKTPERVACLTAIPRLAAGKADRAALARRLAGADTGE